MTVFQAHQTIFCDLLEKTGDTNEARAGARLLMDDLIGVNHAHLTQPDTVLPAWDQTRFETARGELQSNRPLPYILGKCEFYALYFQCDERALIPRPETELLVEIALKKIGSSLSQTPTPKIADMGTGTGCVAISIAENCADAQICASDISPAALTLARENAERHNLTQRIEFVVGTRGEWAAPLREYSRRNGSDGFDIIVSNPPYIAPHDIENLPPPIKDFEPRSALDGGPDGLDCYRQIAAQCGEILKEDGILACELGAGQFADVRTIFETQNWRVQNPILDFAGIERVLVAQAKI